MRRRSTTRAGRGRRAGRWRLWLLAGFAVLLACCMAQAADPSGERISAVVITGLTSLDEAGVRSVIEIEPGDPFTLESTDAAVERLRKWGVFDAIDVYPSMTPEGISLDFNLQEAITVAAIDVSGNYPYIENKVRKHLSLHPGDVFTPDRIDEQIERIRDFYLRQGYVGTEVAVEQEQLPDENQVVLTFKIHHGELLRYRTIEVSGNHAFPDSRFTSLINTWKPFSEQRLRASLRRMKELYHEHGYPRARVNLARKHVDFEAKRVDIAIEIVEGPYVVVAFTGDHETHARMLRKALTIFKEGSIDQDEIEASQEAIKEMLRNRGYPEARVEASQEQRPDGTIVITFDVDEGSSQRIRFLRFEGNRDVGARELRANLKNREMAYGRRGAYHPEAQQQDDEAMRVALKRKGFLEGQVGEWQVKPSPQGFALDVTVPVEEGQQTMVANVEFAGETSFEHKKLLDALKIRPGKPLDEPGLPEDRERLQKFYADHGHPYAVVRQSWTRDEEGRAQIRYDIDEGTLVRVGEILIVGDVLTSQKAIRNAMDIREGDPFSYKKVVDSQLNIRRLGPFSVVTIETIGISEHKDRVHLKIKVEEQRPFLLDVGLAYSTDNGLTGTLAFNNINAFGWAKTNSLKLTAGRKLSRAEIGWLDPRFLSSSVQMGANAWVQYNKQPAYTYTQMGGSIGWAKTFTRLGFSFRWEMDRNYFVEGDSTAADADSLRDNTLSILSLFGSYDGRDSFSEPTRGIFASGGVAINNEIKGAQANFAKFSWQFEYDQKLVRRVVFSTALRFDRIQDIGSNVSVPTNQLLFMGGDNTIRGFAYESLGPVDAAGNATGGRLRWVVNEEMRIRILKNLGAVIFYDMGSLTNNFSQMDVASIRNSIGLGLRYLTPVGPIRAEYGFKLDKGSNESLGRFHFTFGYIF